MSDEDSDGFDLDNLSELEAKAHGSIDKYPLVSGWEDDTDGVEEERNPDNTSARNILKAAEDGKLNEVIKLISLDKSLVNVADRDGYSPLHRASYNNHTEIVKFLLDNGANISAQTIDNWQPLHSACKWNSLESAETLIQYGADVNASSQGGVTPLHLAAGNSHAVSLIQLLISHPLLKPNAKDNCEDTPSDIAARAGPNSYLFECFDDCFV